jgi:hypothetical protein
MGGMIRDNFASGLLRRAPSQAPASFTVDQIEKDVESKIKAMAKTPATQ